MTTSRPEAARPRGAMPCTQRLLHGTFPPLSSGRGRERGAPPAGIRSSSHCFFGERLGVGALTRQTGAAQGLSEIRGRASGAAREGSGVRRFRARFGPFLFPLLGASRLSLSPPGGGEEASTRPNRLNDRSLGQFRAPAVGFRAALTPSGPETPPGDPPPDRQPGHTANPNIHRNNTCRTTLKPTSQVRSKLLIPLVNFPEFLVDSLITRD